MRFTTLVLAAGSTAFSLAAPVAQNQHAQAGAPNGAEDGTCPLLPSETSLLSATVTAVPTAKLAAGGPYVNTTLAPSSTIIQTTVPVFTSTTSSAAASGTGSSGASKLQWFGANESGI